MTIAIGTAVRDLQLPRRMLTRYRLRMDGGTFRTSQAANRAGRDSTRANRPLLLVDVDGVISLFGFPPHLRPDGDWLMVDGISHLISAGAGAHLRTLSARYELVWCTGWEEKANDYLPAPLGLPGPLPHLRFDAAPSGLHAHWKLGAIERHAGLRPVAWIDDAHDGACEDWAASRDAPTLLVSTRPERGLAAEHVAELEAWADGLDAEHPDGGATGAGPSGGRGSR